MTRRQVIGAGASVVLLPRPGLALAQDRPEPRPHTGDGSSETTGRDTSSWFVVSRQAGAGYNYSSERFEVYDGRTFEQLGGFPTPGTYGTGVTANGAKVLLDDLGGPAIFDLGAGEVTPITWDASAAVTSVLLPDPRWASATPLPWTVFSDPGHVRAFLVNLDTASGVDLADTLVRPGETAAYPSLRFTPDARLAAGTVSYNGCYLFDPATPEDARPLDGGRDGMVSWGPDFSPAGSRITYALREPTGEPGPGTLVVEDLEGGDVVEVGGVDEDGFGVFPPDSDDELLVFDDGAVTRIEIDGGREVWRAETEAVVVALGVSDELLLVGSAPTRSGERAWQTIDLATGESRRLPELDGLTYYNPSHVSEDTAYQLMGPLYDPDQYITGPLAAIDMASGSVITLLDRTSGTDLSLAYGTSRDSGVVLFTPRDETTYHLFDLASGEHRPFDSDAPTGELDDAAVGPDGAAAGYTLWDPTGAGRMEVRLLDIAGGGEPEALMEGRLWCWTGDAADPTAAHPGARPVASLEHRRA